MKNSLKTALFINIFALSSTFGSFAQDTKINPIITGVPSLTIAPDARGGGMGDVGAATTPDVYSQYWNPAKYAFATQKTGVGLSYTPWLTKVAKDIALMQVAGYYKLGNNNNQALSASIRYFSIGDIQMSDAQGVIGNTVSPHEMAIDLGYSRKLTETFSGAVAIRYIRTDYSTGDDTSSPGNAFAADVAGYNESYVNLGQSEALLGLGFNISNIGTKISSDGGNTNYFIPTNLRVGGSFAYPLDKHNTLSLSTDLNKLLVPTPPLKGVNETDDNYQKRVADYNNTGSFSGIFKSFGDGFSNEMKEITWSFGLEYDYDQRFKLRTGYFHESQDKGNRRYLTFGAGFRMKMFQLDAAYLVATQQSNPLDQTLRLSLAFNL